MKVKMCDIALLLDLRVGGRNGSLMDPHRVRERAREQIVVPFRDDRESLSKRDFLVCRQMQDGRYVPFVRED